MDLVRYLKLNKVFNPIYYIIKLKQVACKQCNSHGNRPRPNLLPNTESNACNTCRNDFGYMKCLACQDKDRTKCKTCLGSKEMKHVIWARATFETFKDDLIKNNSNIPSDLLRNNCNKDIIFHEELDRVYILFEFNYYDFK
jgi:hypothetical protein